MRLAALYVFLAGCGPVLLGEEYAPDAGTIRSPTTSSAGAGESPGADPEDPGASDTMPTVTVGLTSLDCGRCFLLQAEATGGVPPYAFEWDDGTSLEQRLLCLVNDTSVQVTVLARDAASRRSEPHTLQLRATADAGCPQPVPPPEPGPGTLCLENLSFEGTPAANLGQTDAFDAAPWTACTNPTATNTPDIGNASVVETLGWIPDPTHGETFLALGEGEQASQAFCEPLTDRAPIHVELDLTRLNIGAGIVPETEQVFLEIWGGLSLDCSQHDLLWASPALAPSWTTYCVTLRPQAFMTQLTLRANADGSLTTPAYLLVDNMRVVDGCP